MENNNTEQIITIINTLETNLDKLKKLINYDKLLLENNRIEQKELQPEIQEESRKELNKEEENIKEMEQQEEVENKLHEIQEEEQQKEIIEEEKHLSENDNILDTQKEEKEDKREYIENNNLVLDTNSEHSTELLDKEDEELLKNAKIDFLYHKNTKKNTNKKLQSKKRFHNNEMQRGLDI